VRRVRPLAWRTTSVPKPFWRRGFVLAIATPRCSDRDVRRLSLVLLAVLFAGCSSMARTRTVQAAPRIGAPGPAAHCTTTLTVGADIQNALSTAKPGAVVCLNPGTYGDVTLTGINHSRTVTLAPTPGASVHIGGLTFVGPRTTSNLTVEGLFIDSGVDDRTGTPGGLVFRYDTIEGVRGGYAYYFYADGSSSGNYTQRGVKMLYNRIDHVGACLEVDGGAGMAFDFTFSHNICGPGVGAGATVPSNASHYLQIGGITGFVADNNAFLGPMDPNYERAGLHNNVLHTFGQTAYVHFANNFMWHTQSRGQTILLEEGKLDDLTIDNNLDVEDPQCDVRGNCSGYAIYVDDAHGLTVQDNTIVDSYWGVLLTDANSMGYPGGANYRITRNIAVGTRGNPALSYGRCFSTCIFDYNVTDDRSANQHHPTHFVTRWRTKWRSTRWVPSVADATPPAGYYSAIGLPWAAGYRGKIGP
jgi:hypothetical protein